MSPKKVLYLIIFSLSFYYLGSAFVEIYDFAFSKRNDLDIFIYRILYYLSVYFLYIFLLFFGFFKKLDNFVRKKAKNTYIRWILFLGIMELIVIFVKIPFHMFESFYWVVVNLWNIISFLQNEWIYILYIILEATISLALVILVYKKLKWWKFIVILTILYPIFSVSYIYTTQYITTLNEKCRKIKNKELEKNLRNIIKKENVKIDSICIEENFNTIVYTYLYFNNYKIYFWKEFLNKHSKQEALSAFYHEIYHIKENHILKLLLLDTFFAFFAISLLYFILKSDNIHKALSDKKSIWISYTIFILLLIPISTIWDVIKNYVSRQYEKQADLFAIKHTNKETLNKILQDDNEKHTKLYKILYYNHPIDRKY